MVSDEAAIVFGSIYSMWLWYRFRILGNAENKALHECLMWPKAATDCIIVTKDGHTKNVINR